MRRMIPLWTMLAAVAIVTPGCPDDGGGAVVDVMDAAAGDATGDAGADAGDTLGDTGPGDAGPGDVSDGGLADVSDGGPGDAGPADVSDGGPGDAGPADVSDGGPGDGGPGDADAGPWEWPVETAPIAITPHESWKNTIEYSLAEPFAHWGSDVYGAEPRWVKFTVLMGDPTKVYFQNSYSYPFHSPFAVERLDPFVGMSLGQFDDVSLHAQGQQAILGAVLMPPTSEGPAEIGIQLVRQDPYHREMVRVVFDLVRAAVQSSEPVAAFYFPTYEQAEQAATDAEWLAAHDIPLSDTSRWAQGDACYALGWAIGRLTYTAGDQIDAAYAAGTLLPTDILLTDGVPAEVPFVAGILSLTPSTPNSHVAILAGNFGIPFAHLALSPSKEAAQALVGHRVLLRARAAYWSNSCVVDVVALDDLDETVWQQLLALKEVPPLELTPKKTLGQLSKPTDQLVPSDVQYFGGKATNFAVLRAAVPNNSPFAIAISFDLFDAFLDQPAGGKTLRQLIDDKVGAIGWPTDVAAAKAALAEVRALVEDGAFTQTQTDSIVAALAPFDPNKRIRFRSSTNVEDSDTFTGAGLYDGYSGCLADDLDGDATGPSVCDPSEPKERGVLRAIRKVYASFWNDNAFLERRRRQVDEATVGMALLVHHSYPDEIELANGVATLRTGSGSDIATLVTQKGAVSVTNPAGGALPEVVYAGYSTWNDDIWLTFSTGSTLVPLGAKVLEWETEYLALAKLIDTVRDAWMSLHPGEGERLLDLEYKKIAGGGPGALQIKQVRAVAVPADLVEQRILVGDSLTLCTFQGEYGDVMANHRLKSRWELVAASGAVDPKTPGPVAADADVTWVDDGVLGSLIGAPADWSGSATTWDGDTLVTTFQVGMSAGDGAWTLHAAFPQAPASQGPVTLLRDLSWDLRVDHPAPVPTFSWDGQIEWVTTEWVRLEPCPTAADALPTAQSNQVTAGGVTVDTSWYWPHPPTGIVAGYTAPLVMWDQTTIAGLTTEPIVLHGWYSQTYRPEHHNFSQWFAYEPRLEDGISSTILQELDDKQIRLIVAYGSWDTGTIRLIAPDGTVTLLEGAGQ